MSTSVDITSAASATVPTRRPFGASKRAGWSRRVVKLFLAAAAGLGSFSLAAGAAPASQRLTPWNVDYHDFGTTPGYYMFTFTNIYKLPLVDKPVPFTDQQLTVVRDSCETVVKTGASCRVVVRYSPYDTPAPVPVTQNLQLSFETTKGKPFATPPVQIFAGDAEYVATQYRNGVVTFPTVKLPKSGRHARTSVYLLIWFYFHGGNPVDIPPYIYAPFKLVSNSCVPSAVTDKGCAVRLAFAPKAAGHYSENFQMSFEGRDSQVSVPTQDLILAGNATR
jgi:hypothetical protein